MGSAKRILVCDDDDLLVELLHFRLSAKGFDVCVARDGSEAIESASEAAPDAIVLDAMMPVIDGYEVLRQIREAPHMRHLPIIMLTARKGEKDIVEALELGASDYLAKPFIPEELTARLTRLLAQAA